jgi:hypothetical protein
MAVTHPIALPDCMEHHLPLRMLLPSGLSRSIDLPSLSFSLRQTNFWIHSSILTYIKPVITKGHTS